MYSGTEHSSLDKQPTLETMEKIEPQVTPNDYAAHKENGAPLSRQVTVNLSNEQYERLFLAPGPPAKGDFAKRFGMLP